MFVQSVCPLFAPTITFVLFAYCKRFGETFLCVVVKLWEVMGPGDREKERKRDSRGQKGLKVIAHFTGFIRTQRRDKERGRERER